LISFGVKNNIFPEIEEVKMEQKELSLLENLSEESSDDYNNDSYQVVFII